MGHVKDVISAGIRQIKLCGDHKA